MESTITNCASFQVLVYDNRAGVAHDSLCAVSARRRLPTMYNHATNAAAGSTHWTIRTMHAGSLCMSVTWSSLHNKILRCMNGNLVVQKSRRKFSLMAKDQAHEQSNKILQTKGGAAGLYEKHEALMLFMLAGRDWARMVGEFEAIHDLPPYSTGHHEEGPSCKRRSERIYHLS